MLGCTFGLGLGVRVRQCHQLRWHHLGFRVVPQQSWQARVLSNKSNQRSWPVRRPHWRSAALDLVYARERPPLIAEPGRSTRFPTPRVQTPASLRLGTERQWLPPSQSLELASGMNGGEPNHPLEIRTCKRESNIAGTAYRFAKSTICSRRINNSSISVARRGSGTS